MLTLYGEVDCLPLGLKPQLRIGGADLWEVSPPATHGGDKACRGTVNGLGLSTLGDNFNGNAWSHAIVLFTRPQPT